MLLIAIILSVLVALPQILIGLLIAFGFYMLGKLFKSKALILYGFNIAITLDQLVNVVLLGDADETISGRLGRAMKSGKAKWFVPQAAKIVDWLALHLFDDKDHVANSIEDEDQIYSREIWSWING